MFRNLYKVCLLLGLSSYLVMTGCANHQGIIGSAPPVISSSVMPSSTTSAPTPYHGEVVLAQAGEGPADIWADKYYCYPNVLTVKAGTTVTWTNLDIIPFTVVSDNGMFAGNISANRGIWSYLFAYPGTFGYSIDPYNATLLGEVIVVE